MSLLQNSSRLWVYCDIIHYLTKCFVTPSKDTYMCTSILFDLHKQVYYYLRNPHVIIIIIMMFIIMSIIIYVRHFLGSFQRMIGFFGLVRFAWCLTVVCINIGDCNFTILSIMSFAIDSFMGTRLLTVIRRFAMIGRGRVYTISGGTERDASKR